MKAKDLYDIAIIGTGPAGATLARLLHPKYNIIAIDKKNPHGDGFQKPCGGLICTDAQKALASFDLTLPKDVLVEPQIFAVKTIDLKNKLIRHYQRFYINMDRHKFDLWLESLLPKTVELHSNAVCTELKRENGGFLISYQDLETKQIRTVRAKFLVGADGANSIVRRTFYPEKKLRRYLSIQQWFPETHRNPFYSCIFDPETTDCCSWSISKDHQFIFGGAFPLDHARERFERQKAKAGADRVSFRRALENRGMFGAAPCVLPRFLQGGKGNFPHRRSCRLYQRKLLGGHQLRHRQCKNTQRRAESPPWQSE